MYVQECLGLEFIRIETVELTEKACPTSSLALSPCHMKVSWVPTSN